MRDLFEAADRPAETDFETLTTLGLHRFKTISLERQAAGITTTAAVGRCYRWAKQCVGRLVAVESQINGCPIKAYAGDSFKDHLETATGTIVGIDDEERFEFKANALVLSISRKFPWRPNRLKVPIYANYDLADDSRDPLEPQVTVTLIN